MKIQIKKKDPSLEFINRCLIRFQKDKMPATIEDDGVQIMAEMDMAKTKAVALRRCFNRLRENINIFGVPFQIDGYRVMSIEDFIDAGWVHYKVEVRIYLKKL